MKVPKTQRELVQLLFEQNQQIEKQNEQIRALKQALLRLEQQVRHTNRVIEGVRSNQQLISNRVRLAESKINRQ